ncbi:transcriptional regulator [Leptospira fletcheri]|uniref:Transcriptional regulator n=1 Tax=Leptospira fletcheri TaxID=2484981 RepID=A0A4V3JE47_9LEPT|nr:helix-turn-helix domain-containing protein [Leptospira fletcheri]TGK14065.1 transcriptional regulator [Leptospira fletcheri]
MKKSGRSSCPIGLSLDILGDRWTLLILRDILLRGMTRYKDFLEAGEGIATNLLAQRLLWLEEQGLITKTDDPANGKQFIYAPTPKSLDLLPVLWDLSRWGLKHLPDAKSNPLADRMLKNEAKFQEKIRAKFTQHKKGG